MKKLLALLLSVLILATSGLSAFALSIGSEVTDNVPALSISGMYTANELNQGRKIVENDNYIFVSLGKKTATTTAGAVLIYDKATGAYIRRIAIGGHPVKDFWVDGNKLYISFGNTMNTTTGVGTRMSAANAGTSSAVSAPVMCYDVTSVTANEAPTCTYVCDGGAYAAGHVPYTTGSISYLDEENHKLYISKIASKTSGGRQYYIYDTTDTDVARGFRIVSGSFDTAKFIVKDGWLYEIHQNNGGFVKYTASSTMTGNNEVRIYDLNADMPNLPASSVGYGKFPDLGSRLKAKYVTAASGGDAIKDIEIIGDTMYVATTLGIEVVNLTPAKADGITSETAVDLLAARTITEDGKGGVMELKNIDGKLWAGFYGPELYSSMGESVYVNNVLEEQPTSGDGALVVYTAAGEKIADKAIPYGVADFLMKDGSVYVVHDVGSDVCTTSASGKTKSTSPKLSAYSLEFAEAAFNTALGLSGEITQNIPAIANISDGKSELNSASKVVENDKYIFVAMGRGAVKTLGGAVLVYDKLTGEYITKITQVTSQTGASPYYNPVKDIEISGDTLYIYWGNGISNLDTGAGLRASGNAQAPVKSYDVSNITEETVFSGTQLTSGNAYAQANAPYTWGGTSYLDAVNGKLYMNFVQNADYGRKQYRVIDITTGTVVNAFYTGNQNTAKFIVKDGWLFEILQNKAGLTTYTGADTMTGNNEIRIFNLNGAWDGLTAIDKSAGSYLRGVYTATVAGDTAIKDVEVIGDTMYVATTAGIDVVDLTAAKADGVTSSTAATLTASRTITNAYGAAMDLEVVDGKLFAGFAGAQVWGAMADSTGKGAVVIYDASMNVISQSEVTYGVADITVNEDEQRIYVVKDTTNTGSVTAIDYVSSSLVLEADGETTSALTEGTFDVKVNLSNADLNDGVLICALYEGNRLSDLLTAVNPGTGVITLAQDYEIGEEITHVKTMFFKDLDKTLAPLCDVVEVRK